MHEKQTANTEYYDLIEKFIDSTFGGWLQCTHRAMQSWHGLTTLLKVKDASILTTWINRMKTIVNNEKEVAGGFLSYL